MEQLRGLGFVNHEAYLCALRVCTATRNGPTALKLIEDFKARSNMPISEALQGELVKAICSGVGPDDKTPVSVIYKKGIDAYEYYIELKHQKQWRSSDVSIFNSAAQAYRFCLFSTMI